VTYFGTLTIFFPMWNEEEYIGRAIDAAREACETLVDQGEINDYELLIIDDMGLKALPKHSGEYLLEVVMRRYENRSTIMTSNRPIQDWGKLLGDVPAASAILDRFLHHAQTIAITGRSYRLKDQTQIKHEKPTQENNDDPAKPSEN